MSSSSEGKGQLTVIDKQIHIIENYFKSRSNDSSESSYKSALDQNLSNSSYKSALEELFDKSLSEPEPEPEAEELPKIPEYAHKLYNKKFTIEDNFFGVGYEVTIIVHKDNKLDFVIKLTGHSYIFNKQIYTDLDVLNHDNGNIHITGNNPKSKKLVFIIEGCTFKTRLIRKNKCQLIIDESYMELINLIFSNIRPNITYMARPKSIRIVNIELNNNTGLIELTIEKGSKTERYDLGSKRSRSKKSKKLKTKRNKKKKSKKRSKRKSKRKSKRN